MALEPLNLLLDSKHILDKPPRPGAGRLAIWWASVRLSARPSRGSGAINICGYQVDYLDSLNLRRMYRDLFVRRIYDVPLGSVAPTIVDCGSNIGLSLLFFNDAYPHARLIGFEPNPVTFPVLQKNMAQNEVRDVALHQIAVAGEPGRIDFYVNTEEPGALNAGLHGTAHNSKVVPVVADRLSRYVDTEVDLLKLDIEGAEETVIQDMAETGVLRQVRNIVCEYHHHHHRHQIESEADRLSMTLVTLERAGFGYQLEAFYDRARMPRVYQDILLYAYRK